ncbi:MAG: 50S ribosomal protein L18Ae [Desulfurococcaceae archaeon]
MSEEVKIYRIVGYMLISHDKNPTWQKFTLELRALNKEQALEKLYSLLGSRHKLKRFHIKILNVEAISPEEAVKPYVKKLLQIERIVKQ